MNSVVSLICACERVRERARASNPNTRNKQKIFDFSAVVHLSVFSCGIEQRKPLKIVVIKEYIHMWVMNKKNTLPKMLFAIHQMLCGYIRCANSNQRKRFIHEFWLLLLLVVLVWCIHWLQKMMLPKFAKTHTQRAQKETKTQSYWQRERDEEKDSNVTRQSNDERSKEPSQLKN